jgi:hypothetical protein
MTTATLRRPPPVPEWQPDAFLLSWAARELRTVLDRSPVLGARTYEIFGQGSRVNHTAIDPSSDIDLVLMLRTPLEVSWEGFRDEVLAAMGESHAVRMGRRCLNVDEPGSLFGEMVDILVATEFRRDAEQGVFFRDDHGRPIVNFPKQHRRRGDAKDRRTGGRFKEVVRAAKRVRKRALTTVDAPPYLLECLLFNVPDQVFRTASAEQAYRGALAWLRRCHTADPVAFAGLPCQNGINRIFGPGPDQWEPGTAARIIDVLHDI